MDKRQIGSLAVSVVGVGCNNFGGRIDEKHSEEVINAALDVGTISSTPPTCMRTAGVRSCSAAIWARDAGK